MTVRFPSAEAARAAGVKGITSGNGTTPRKRSKRRTPERIATERAQVRTAEARAEAAERAAEKSAETGGGQIGIRDPYGPILFSMMVIAVMYLVNARRIFDRLRTGEPLV